MPKNGNTAEKKAARALAAERGIRYTAALRIVREQKAAEQAARAAQDTTQPTEGEN